MNFNEKVVIGTKNPVTTFSIFLGVGTNSLLREERRKIIDVRGISERNFIEKRLFKSVSLGGCQ